MLQDLISLVTPALLILGLLVFFCIKWFRILDLRLPSGELSLFFRSFLMYERQAIRNTFDSGLKRYLEYSNRVNVVFYIYFLLVLTAYLLLGGV